MDEPIESQVPQREPFAVFRRKPSVTYILIALNVLAFLAMTAAGGTASTGVLVRFGAKDSALIWQGQYWRLLAPVFLHAGFVHLAANSYALWQLGRLVELLYGPYRMLAVYLSAGILATTASLIASPAISVGASGAIFGLFGAVLYFACRKPRVFRAIFGYQLFVVLAINVVIGFTLPNIDIFAHAGGLLSGFLAAAAVRLPDEPRRMPRSFLVALLFLGTVSYAVFPVSTSWHYHYFSGRRCLAATRPNLLRITWKRPIAFTRAMKTFGAPWRKPISTWEKSCLNAAVTAKPGSTSADRPRYTPPLRATWLRPFRLRPPATAAGPPPNAGPPSS